MPKATKQVEDLFEEDLKNIYFAEKKLPAALPKMANAAQPEDLAGAFERHADETEEQVTRLEEVFELLDQTPRGKRHARLS
jgi:ferritin-like metal-binding protein YciE